MKGIWDVWKNTQKFIITGSAKLVRIDLRDLENVSDLDKVELLAESLISRVGNPLSYKSLSEDLD